MKKTKFLQEIESEDYYPVDSTLTVEGMIKFTHKTKKEVDLLIEGFIQDGWTRERCLDWFRSFGLYYSKLPDQ